MGHIELKMRYKFQFTHPGGVRPLSTSILRTCFSSFNSRTREGCDLGNYLKMIEDEKFQFTHPGGVRQVCICLFGDNVEFQFTHPGGVRQFRALVLAHSSVVSIHAPGRGATIRSAHISPDTSLFQFTHPGGVRPAILDLPSR